MKNLQKLLCVMMTLGMLLVGCVAPSSQTAILPPTRVGASDYYASFAHSYTFDTALAEADVVARIQVGNWIAEDTELMITYYEATVLQCLKGSIPDTFTLFQDGCSTATMHKYPLFTSGNEMLVFLNEAEETDYDSPYWIIGAYTTLLDVCYDDSGARYYADRCGLLGETMDIEMNYAFEHEIFKEVYANLAAKDPMVTEIPLRYSYVFSEADLLALIKGN